MTCKLKICSPHTAILNISGGGGGGEHRGGHKGDIREDIEETHLLYVTFLE